jgi:hypothetical protein
MVQQIGATSLQDCLTQVLGRGDSERVATLFGFSKRSAPVAFHNRRQFAILHSGIPLQQNSYM